MLLFPTLTTVCFSLAVGFLTPLVWIERPLLSLIWDVASTNVKDADVRRAHSANHAVAVADGPTVCALYQIAGMVFSVAQSWQRGFDLTSVLVAALAAAHIIYSVRKVGAVIKSAKETDPAGDASTVRASIRKVMMLHYTGIFNLTVILMLQYLLIMSRN